MIKKVIAIIGVAITLTVLLLPIFASASVTPITKYTSQGINHSGITPARIPNINEIDHKMLCSLLYRAENFDRTDMDILDMYAGALDPNGGAYKNELPKKLCCKS